MKKRRVLLSGVSILLVLCLLIGGTMAWFTDTEKTERLVRFGSHRAVVRSGIPVRAGYEE